MILLRITFNEIVSLFNYIWEDLISLIRLYQRDHLILHEVKLQIIQVIFNLKILHLLVDAYILGVDLFIIFQKFLFIIWFNYFNIIVIYCLYSALNFLKLKSFVLLGLVYRFFGG